jgi:hypothetical protein|tara:strand:+ start:1132 stop:1602 length:471 start_codon:yes stop_codon:yes gene_type:complete
MSKSKENKTKTFNQNLTETINTYDGTNYIYDGSDDTINTEEEMRKKFKPKVLTWDLMKQDARAAAKKGNYKQLRELRKIEQKMNYQPKPIKKKPIETRRDSSKVNSDTIPAPDIPNFMRVNRAAPPDDTLKKIIEDRNKPDPDFFRGLGQFLNKKF